MILVGVVLIVVKVARGLAENYTVTVHIVARN